MIHRRKPQPYAASLKNLPANPAVPAACRPLTLDIGGWRFSIYQEAAGQSEAPPRPQSVTWYRRMSMRR